MYCSGNCPNSWLSIARGFNHTIAAFIVPIVGKENGGTQRYSRQNNEVLRKHALLGITEFTPDLRMAR